MLHPQQQGLSGQNPIGAQALQAESFRACQSQRSLQLFEASREVDAAASCHAGSEHPGRQAGLVILVASWHLKYLMQLRQPEQAVVTNLRETSKLPCCQERFLQVRPDRAGQAAAAMSNLERLAFPAAVWLFQPRVLL